MRNNRSLGIIGEDYAENYLKNEGYSLLERNWTLGHKEIDLIVKKDNVIVFVEVKTRKSTAFGQPEEAVSRQKMKLIMQAAEHYLEQTTYDRVRFDVISIRFLENNRIDFLHIEDAFA